MFGLLFRLLGRLPLRWIHVLGGFSGRLVYMLSPRYRKHLQANMAQAGLAPTLRMAAAVEAGKQAFELARIWTHPLEETRALIVETRGWAHIEAAQRRGQGILFLTPHLGCFEITAQFYAAIGEEITVLYRPPKQKGLQQMIEQGRRRERLHLAPADLSGVRTLIRALKRGQAVGMLPDQAPQTGEGVWLDFFGRPAYTMTLAARLSQTGAAVILAWGERLPAGTGYRLHFSLPSEPLTGETLERAARINREMERLVLQCPTQYLWGYNRYKKPAGVVPPPSPT